MSTDAQQPDVPLASSPPAPSEQWPRLPVPLALIVILLVAGAIAMRETDRLVTGMLTSTGESHSITDVIGIAALGGTDAWVDWLSLDDPERHRVAVWMVFHALFDVAFYAAYFILLRHLVAGVPLAMGALHGLLGLEILETILLVLGSVLLYVGWVPVPLRVVLAGVAFIKWITGAFVLLVALVSEWVRGRITGGGLRVLRAIREQGLSFALVAVMGVLSLVPLPHIWDQLPDVQRTWFDNEWKDGLHPVLALLATGVVAVYLFVVGRLRSERVWISEFGNSAEGPDPSLEPPVWRWWFVPPAVALVVAAVLIALRLEELIYWRNLAIVVGIPLVILIASWAVRGVSPPELAGAKGLAHARLVWVTGDVLAVSVVVIAGLGLVRSLIAPVLLGPGDSGLGIWIVRVVVLLAGAALAGAAFPVADKLLGALDSADCQPQARLSQSKRLKWLCHLQEFLRPSAKRAKGGPLSVVAALALWLAAIAALAILMILPLQVSRLLGVVATTVVALGAWAAVLGFIIVHLQHHKPLPVFSLLRLRATPVLTLLLVVLIVTSWGGGDPDLHALSRPPAGGSAPDLMRPSLSTAFGNWLDRSKDCDRPVGGQGEQRVRPMVLVAASGGGIRAAFWTAQVLERLESSGSCGAQAVFLSSGVSGGSLGLALSRGGDPTGEVEQLAQPDALAAGLAGTLVGDLIASATGLRVPSLALADNGREPAGRHLWDWRDRAGLMEAAWESQARSLTARYDETLSGPAGVLVMNSAAAGRGCRVLVSQVELATVPQERADTTGTSTGSGTGECQGQTGQPAASVDLHGTYGACLWGMSWATAAMLSARFPTITPAGRVAPDTKDCRDRPELQLIDGGYAEGSGIGTLADIGPALLQVVRDHNATAGAGVPLVVPLVLYLEDETRKDIVRQPQGLSPELFVPLAGRNAQAVQISSGTWLQRVASAIADPCPPDDRQRCLRAVDQVRGTGSGGIFIAAPLTEPSVEPPLGWTLSEDSRTRLEEAADDAAAECPKTPPPVGGYPCLGRLLAILKAEA